MAKNAVEATDENFSALIASEKVTLVDFWAEWCGPCQMLGPVVEEIAGEYLDKAIVAKLDVDANPNISAQFGVRSIPTLLFFKNGELVHKLVGVVPKATLTAALDTL
jgi:thioredoxin 1